LGNLYSNIEVLVGDDCSTDSTVEEISKFTHDPRVRFFQGPVNRGAGAMRNLLLAQAKGELIAMQDADDEFDPSRFVKQVEVILQGKADVVGTGAVLKSREGKTWLTLSPPKKPATRDWFFQRAMVHASILFKKEILGSVRYHEGLKYGEDYYFLTQLYLKGARFENIPEPLYVYNIEREKLIERSLKKTWEIILAKWQIAQLFSVLHGAIFFIVNAGLVAAGFFLQSFRNKQS
jgi:hypothetical protein